MSAALSPSHGPLTPEFRGKARDLIARLAAEDKVVEDTMDGIYTPLRATLRRRSIPRPSALTGAVQAWRTTMPTLGRLALETEIRGRRHLLIRELRLSATRVNLDDWEGSQPGVALVLVGLKIDSRHWSCTHELIAGAHIHALGRLLHRNFEDDDGTVRKEMLALAVAAETAPTTDGAPFAVNVPSGRWVGVIRSVEDRPVPIARSFLT